MRAAPVFSWKQLDAMVVFLLFSLFFFHHREKRMEQQLRGRPGRE